MFHRPMLTAATCHRYIVPNTCSKLSIQLPAGLQWNPIQMAEVVHQYILDRVRLYPRMNVANTVHSHTTVTACCVKTGSLSVI